jgi:hypothetical protein
MSIKISGLLLVFILFVAACAPQVSKRQATQVIPAVATPSTPITSPVAVPKQKDLIFIEFFAGT